MTHLSNFLMGLFSFLGELILSVIKPFSITKDEQSKKGYTKELSIR